jgi:hypothetical protein
VTGEHAGAAVTINTPAFSAASGLAEPVSVRKQKVSAKGKRKRGQRLTLAETRAGLQVNVDDQSLLGFIAAGRVGVHKSGSRQQKHGQLYDYRSHYRALRLNDGGREVLAFGTPERLIEKLATIGVHLCLDHRRAVLTAGNNCRQCGGREVIARSATQ